MNSPKPNIKLYLLDKNSTKVETRLLEPTKWSFRGILIHISEVFPQILSEDWYVFWKDQEGDEITISTEEEWTFAMNQMKPDTVKLYVKAKESENKKNDLLHEGVYCDECAKEIFGFRYKCLGCVNFDLCSLCEQLSLHPEHVMLRIPKPMKREDLRKLLHSLKPISVAFRHESGKHGCHYHHRRRHSHENGDIHKKKRKCRKNDSVLDNEESESEIYENRFPYGKWTKMDCDYAHLIKDVIGQFYPMFFEGEAKDEPPMSPKAEAAEEATHLNYLKNVGKTLTSLLDPLGIDVDFEIKSKNEKKDGKKATEPQKETSPGVTPTTPAAAATTAAPTTPPAASVPSTSSGASPKGVHFPPSGITEDAMRQKIEEMTKTFAEQKMSESPERDGWVVFEGPKPETGKNEAANAEATASSSASANITPQASAPPQESQKIYPDLASQNLPKDPAIRQSLEKMLSMGFSNDGGWLTYLLEAKKGDINQALEVLAPHKEI